MLDRLYSLDEKWLGMTDDARCWLGAVEASKFDAAAAAHEALVDSERLFLAAFRRRAETVADIAVNAAHDFMLLDRNADDEALNLARRALADIATTGAEVAGMDFSAIWAPRMHGRLRDALSGQI
jgi:hypothetical protein